MAEWVLSPAFLISNCVDEGCYCLVTGWLFGWLFLFGCLHKWIVAKQLEQLLNWSWARNWCQLS